MRKKQLQASFGDGMAYELPTKKKNRKSGGKGQEMPKLTSTEPKSSKKYAKTRGEHYKDIVIAILVTAILAFMVGMRFADQQHKELSAVSQRTAWNCAAEDEVVIIDGSCKHIDTLTEVTAKK